MCITAAITAAAPTVLGSLSAVAGGVAAARIIHDRQASEASKPGPDAAGIVDSKSISRAGGIEGSEEGSSLQRIARAKPLVDAAPVHASSDNTTASSKFPLLYSVDQE
jgi:hypothetical protein